MGESRVGLGLVYDTLRCVQGQLRARVGLIVRLGGFSDDFQDRFRA